MNEGYRAWGTLKSLLSNCGVGINAKKFLYDGNCANALYEAVARRMRSAERMIVNVLEMRSI